jgi:hypothetical protein
MDVIHSILLVLLILCGLSTARLLHTLWVFIWDDKD